MIDPNNPLEAEIANPTTFSETWETYRKIVLPFNASEVQVTECRRAFYSGALGFISLIEGMLPAIEPVTIEDQEAAELAEMTMMEAIKAELEEFQTLVLQGKA